MLQRVAACCSVLQCIVVCAAVVLQLCRLWKKMGGVYVAVCCSVLQCLVVSIAVFLQLKERKKEKKITT